MHTQSYRHTERHTERTCNGYLCVEHWRTKNWKCVLQYGAQIFVSTALLRSLYLLRKESAKSDSRYVTTMIRLLLERSKRQGKFKLDSSHAELLTARLEIVIATDSNRKLIWNVLHCHQMLGTLDIENIYCFIVKNLLFYDEKCLFYYLVPNTRIGVFSVHCSFTWSEIYEKRKLSICRAGTTFLSRTLNLIWHRSEEGGWRNLTVVVIWRSSPLAWELQYHLHLQTAHHLDRWPVYNRGRERGTGNSVFIIKVNSRSGKLSKKANDPPNLSTYLWL